jgi:hypothetical protein
MKSSTLLIGALFIMSISLTGQTKFTNCLIKDLRLDSVNIDILDKNHHSNNLYHPFVYSSSNLRKGSGFIYELNQKRYGRLPQNFIFNQGFIVASEYHEGYRNFDNMPIIKPDMNGYLRILKPDSTVIYYLRGQKPFYSKAIK